MDELNLAPSDVLEALNRLLDDNKEFLLVETGEVIKPHPSFRLFATQNPAGDIYGGRKHLSRAFRNRFVEIFFDDIPFMELESILTRRCHLIAPSYAKKLVKVFLDLQQKRAKKRILAGKDGFMTLRDLFRWGNRVERDLERSDTNENINYEQSIAEHGYMLLAERCRTDEEREIVHQAIEASFKCKIEPEKIYDSVVSILCENSEIMKNISWTSSFCRLFALVKKCFDNNEPCLLVGETGVGKTTVFQIYASLMKRKLHIVNCHQNMETSDMVI